MTLSKASALARVHSASVRSARVSYSSGVATALQKAIKRAKDAGCTVSEIEAIVSKNEQQYTP